jgi:GNAT superfamily N-acetyltransferase
MHEVLIRPGKPEDFPAIDAFDPFGGDRQKELATGQILVAILEEKIAGFITYSPYGFIYRPFVHYLAIHPEFRRRGLAILLLDAVKEKVKTGRLFISTEIDNAPMHQLFKSHGWTHAGCVQGVNFNGNAECFFYVDLI